MDTCRLGLWLPAGILLPGGGFCTPVLLWEPFQALSVRGKWRCGGDTRTRKHLASLRGPGCAPVGGGQGVGPTLAA